MNQEKKINKQLKELQNEHKELESKIESFFEEGAFLDQLMLQRVKRKKLQIKDKIISLQQLLCDDIIA